MMKYKWIFRLYFSISFFCEIFSDVNLILSTWSTKDVRKDFVDKIRWKTDVEDVINCLYHMKYHDWNIVEKYFNKSIIFVVRTLNDKFCSYFQSNSITEK